MESYLREKVTVNKIARSDNDDSCNYFGICLNSYDWCALILLVSNTPPTLVLRISASPRQPKPQPLMLTGDFLPIFRP